jgi:beta-glucosidase
MIVDRAHRGDVGLLFLGDSITEAMLGHRDLLNKYFGNMKPVPFGIGGDRTQHLIWRIQNGELDGISPKVLVLLIGTNNISAGDHDVDIVRGVQAVIKEIHSRLPKTKIVLLGLLPRDAEPSRTRKHISYINANFPKLADNKTVWFIDVGDKFLDQKGNLPADLMPDYLHPSSKGYEVLFEQIKPLVEKLYKSS